MNEYLLIFLEAYIVRNRLAGVGVTSCSSLRRAKWSAVNRRGRVESAQQRLLPSQPVVLFWEGDVKALGGITFG